MEKSLKSENRLEGRRFSDFSNTVDPDGLAFDRRIGTIAGKLSQRDSTKNIPLEIWNNHHSLIIFLFYLFVLINRMDSKTPARYYKNPVQLMQYRI